MRVLAYGWSLEGSRGGWKVDGKKERTRESQWWGLRDHERPHNHAEEFGLLCNGNEPPLKDIDQVFPFESISMVQFLLLLCVCVWFFFWLCRVLAAAHMWDLIPWPGSEPGPPALGAQGLTHRNHQGCPIWYSFKPKGQKNILTLVLAKGRVSLQDIRNIRNPSRNWTSKLSEGQRCLLGATEPGVGAKWSFIHLLLLLLWASSLPLALSVPPVSLMVSKSSWILSFQTDPVLPCLNPKCQWRGLPGSSLI